MGDQERTHAHARDFKKEGRIMEEDIKETKAVLRHMQQDIDKILKAIETREYTMSPEMEDKVYNIWQKQYDGGPVSKMPVPEYEPLSQIETRTYYCGPLSKSRNEDVFDYAIYDHD